MDMNIGKSDYPQGAVSMRYTDAFQKRMLNNLPNGLITNGKKQILYAVKIQLTSYDVGTESFEKIREEFYEKFTTNLTEAFMSFMIQAATVEKASYADGYMNEISDFMYHQLLELHKELSNMWPVAIEDKELSLLIFHAAANGLMNYMRGSKQSKMDWFTTPDIVQKCETSGE